jgi:hypothetical protein
VSGPTFRLDSAAMDSATGAVQTAASDISRRLGWRD